MTEPSQKRTFWGIWKRTQAPRPNQEELFYFFEIYINNDWCDVLGLDIEPDNSKILYAVILYKENVQYRFDLFGQWFIGSLVAMRTFCIVRKLQTATMDWTNFVSQFETSFVQGSHYIPVEQQNKSNGESRCFGITSISIDRGEISEKIVFKFELLGVVLGDSYEVGGALYNMFTIQIDEEPLKSSVLCGDVVNGRNMLRVKREFTKSQILTHLLLHCRLPLYTKGKSIGETVTQSGFKPEIKLLERYGSAPWANRWFTGLILEHSESYVGEEEEEGIQEIQLYFTNLDLQIGSRHLYTLYFELESIRGWACKPKITDVHFDWNKRIGRFETSRLEFPRDATPYMLESLSRAVSSGKVLVTLLEQHTGTRGTLIGVQALTFQRDHCATFTFVIVEPTRRDPPMFKPLSFSNWDWTEHRARFNQEYISPHLSDAELGHFTPLHFLASGSFGLVQLVKHNNTGQYYAMKIMIKEAMVSNKEVTQALNEKQIMASLDFPFLVPLRFHFQDAKYLYLVVDFVNGGDLSAFLKAKGKLREHTCRFYAAQLILTINYLHSLDVVYRDLKPANLLLDGNGNIMLAYVGCAKKLEKSTLKTKADCGTQGCYAPEMLKTPKDGYGKEVDWYPQRKCEKLFCRKSGQYCVQLISAQNIRHNQLKLKTAKNYASNRTNDVGTV